jgi:N-acetylneuraminic acid mutarotase
MDTLRFSSRTFRLAALSLAVLLCACPKKEHRDRDITPPATVADLIAFSGSAPGTILLRWTASGDDGTDGQAASYTVYYDTAPITISTLASAQVYGQSWTPIPSGMMELRLLVNLNPGDHLYLRILVTDDVGNASDLSNEGDALVTVPDVTAPAQVTDLAATPGTSAGSIDLSWTAPGDDGTTGAARAYEIRTSLAAINGGNYGQAVIHPQNLTPKVAGNPETLQVLGLIPGGTYHFALRATDEASNVSAVSNDASAQAAAGNDVWARLTPSDVPTPRSSSCTAWTGDEVLVWGGIDSLNNHLNDGSRYCPSTQSWTAITSTAAPSVRGNHEAVWTGTEMLVWGGDDGSAFPRTGGRYDPFLNRWGSISMNGAPLGRRFHTVVWTGTEMIVWGGEDGTNYFGDGAAYDPATDTWRPLPSQGAPSPRIFHTSVWTGTEMIVWGGYDGLNRVNNGARYNPVSDTWVTMADLSSGVLPRPERSRHGAVWTGTEMIIWGGVGQFSLENDGARYDPVMNSWTAISGLGAPTMRYFHTAAWTGTEMIVWGGLDTQLISTGGKYNPSTDSWTSMSTVGVPLPRWWPAVVWTGNELMVWGGFDTNAFFGHGSLYDPGLDSWRPISGADTTAGPT